MEPVVDLPPTATTPVTHDDERPADADVPDNYVSHTLKTAKRRPPITRQNWYREVEWVSASVIFGVPAATIYGFCTTTLQTKTAIFAVLYYFFTGLGITMGYHRLWAHRSYNASRPLQYVLALAGAGAVQGSIKWWSRGHRAHHRYTDTELDPYNAHRGFWYSHVGWILITPRLRPGVADVSDLSKSDIVQWQHKYFVRIMIMMSFVLPTLIAGLGWGDWWGGWFFAGHARLMFVHHSTFCVNSLAHWLGDSPFDDKHTPRDHFITALVTIGEGYHNFHHQFPMDYRNAIKWYQYDPTRSMIWLCSKLGLATHLKRFPDNEVRKGQLTMQLKRLHEVQETLTWATEEDLPVASWSSYQAQAAERPLVLVAGFIHDLSDFLDEHPGGRHLLTRFVGKDATAAFFGGVYDHSNAAHNLLSMKRVGILFGGHPHASEDRRVPPAQRLRVARYSELSSSAASSSAPSESGITTPL